MSNFLEIPNEITPEFQRFLDMVQSFREELVAKEKMFGDYCVVVNVGNKPTFVYKQIEDFTNNFLEDVKNVDEQYSIECFLMYYR